LDPYVRCEILIDGAAAVWPKQSKHFAGRERNIKSVADDTVRIADGEIAALDIHDRRVRGFRQGLSIIIIAHALSLVA
jgi:hypothetical protein